MRCWWHPSSDIIRNDLSIGDGQSSDSVYRGDGNRCDSAASQASGWDTAQHTMCSESEDCTTVARFKFSRWKGKQGTSSTEEIRQGSQVCQAKRGKRIAEGQGGKMD